MKAKQMEIIASLIGRVISAKDKSAEASKVAKEVDKITEQFPLYPELWKE
jgi:glycine/serine hydroxymethyltransferase